MKKEKFVDNAIVIDNTGWYLRVELQEGIMEESRRIIDERVNNIPSWEIGSTIEVWYISGSGYGVFEFRKIKQ